MRSIARSAASTRPPPAQGSRRTVLSENKVRSKRNERFASGKSFVSLFIAFRGLLIQRIVNSTELPSRRAGGGFGHIVRVVLPRISVIPIIAPPRARGRRPRRAVGEQFYLRTKPAQRETNDSAAGQIVRFSLKAFAGFSKYIAVLRGQSGTALTPGGRWLRPLRQSGIASNRCNTTS